MTATDPREYGSVRNTHSTQTRELWHRVASYSSQFKGGRYNRAHTVCGLVYDFPTANTVFSKQLGECTSENVCGQCYPPDRLDVLLGSFDSLYADDTEGGDCGD